MLRLLVTTRTDVELPVLTRLSLERGSYRVCAHDDVWLDKATLRGPLKRTWGAAASVLGALTGGGGGGGGGERGRGPPRGDDPGARPRRRHRGEEGEQSEPEDDPSRERPGGGGSGGVGGEKEDSGLKRTPPGVEPVPAA